MPTSTLRIELISFRDASEARHVLASTQTGALVRGVEKVGEHVSPGVLNGQAQRGAEAVAQRAWNLAQVSSVVEAPRSTAIQRRSSVQASSVFYGESDVGQRVWAAVRAAFTSEGDTSVATASVSSQSTAEMGLRTPTYVYGPTGDEATATRDVPGGDPNHYIHAAAFDGVSLQLTTS